MTNSHMVREFLPDERTGYKALRLRSLADSPNAFGRTLAEAQKRSDSEWSILLSSGVASDTDLPLIPEVSTESVGLAWGRIEHFKSDTANIYQMWVAPNHRSKGIGGLLLETIIFWAENKQVRYLELGDTFRDSPALRLYKRYGFLPVGEPQEFRPGSDLLGLKMRLELKKAAS